MLVFGWAESLLGTIRQLHAAGCIVTARRDRVSSDGALVPLRFHACPPSSGAAEPAGDFEAWLDGLQFERAVLMPCSDDWTTRVAALPARLRARFPSSVASAAVLDRLIDKGHLAYTMRETGLPAPRTIVLGPGTDPSTLPDSVYAGTFIKPTDSHAFFRRFSVKAFRTSSREEFLARMAEVAEAKLDVELQEYIPGPPSNHYFVDGFITQSGRVAGLFARRRLRMFPRDFGNSTYMESVPLAEIPDAIDTVTRLLEYVGYRGVFSAELKRDARDGICRLIEVNARPWWFVEFAGRCGVNVCAMAVRDALGESVGEQPQYEAGQRCVYPNYDYNACRELFAAGKLSVREWVRSWSSAQQPVARWSDPGPEVRLMATRARHVLSRLGR